MHLSSSTFALSLLCTTIWGCSLFSKSSTDTSPDGGSEGGTTDGGGVGSNTAFQAYLAELGVYRNGGTLPAAGNRGAVTVTVHSDGSKTISIAGANETERVHIDWQSFDSYTLTADVDGDGKVDEQIMSSTPGDVPTTVWQLDNNLNGAFNWRATMTTSPVQNLDVSATVEEIPYGLGNTAFVQTSTYSNAIAMASAACSKANPADIQPMQACDAKTHYPPKPEYCKESPTPPSPPPQSKKPGCFFDGATNDWKSTDLAIRTLTPTRLGGKSIAEYAAITNGAMMCTPERGDIIQAALVKAGPDFDSAVVNTLNATWASIDVAVANSDGILYGCALPSCSPSGVDAITSKAYFADDPNIFITTIAPQFIDMGADVVEEIIIHEWYHLLLQHVPDPQGGSERDFIYACSRIANGGRSWNAGFYLADCCDASSARDAAMCADDTKKLQFGIQMLFKETANGFTEDPNAQLTGYSDKKDPPTCTNASMPVVNAPCSCYLEQAPGYCDQTVLTQDDALKLGIVDLAETISGANCCEACPSATPWAGLGACGTATAGTECVAPSEPPLTCPTLPEGQYATGPTAMWRQPASALAAGQANKGVAAIMGAECEPLAGFPY